MLVRDDTFILYGLYPVIPATLRMILWYLHPYADEFFAKEKVLLTREGVIIHQQGSKLSIITPSDVTMGGPSSITLPGPFIASEVKKVNSQLTPPRSGLRGPTRIIYPGSESIDEELVADINCLTEHNRAHYAINIARAMYQLSEKVAGSLHAIADTNLINV